MKLTRFLFAFFFIFP
ncbi:hypothetical protein BZE31_08120 [Salmonella enterica subsp. enterica serovar Infantis]|nr:hypothetical protein [Salmonella enterica subsp. enterica serovar Arechavaleta]EDE7602103.1 hypothetical protein [Salmonella enterica subsp. enterica serovar Infantis]